VNTSPNSGLALANHQIAETEAHIAHQQRLIECAGSDAEWASQAQDVLHTNQEMLGRMREHRAKLVRSQPRLRRL
jgi:hypothetical protein